MKEYTFNAVGLESIECKSSPETQEKERTIEEVEVLAVKECEDLTDKGDARFQELSEGLAQDDPVVTSSRERLVSISLRARELAKWIPATLALSLATPVMVPKAVAQEVQSTQKNKQDAIEIRRDNPQREAYTTPDKYRAYLDMSWNSYQQSRLEGAGIPPTEERDISDIELERAERRQRSLKSEFRSVNEDGSYRPTTDLELQKLELSTDPRDKAALQAFETSFATQNSDLDKEISYKNSLLISGTEVENLSDKYQKAIENYDGQREWLANITYSPEYRRRLTENEKLPQKDLLVRKSRVVQDPLRVVDTFNSMPIHAVGAWDPDTQRITIPLEEATNPKSSTALHELQHHVTEGDENVSSKAAELYRRSLNVQGVQELALEKKLIYPEHDLNWITEQYSYPTELDARKKEFEYQFEKLTDWRYGDLFTQTRLNQAKQLQKEGQFRGGASDFMRIIDEEHLSEIMNTLAELSPKEKIGGQRDEKV